MLIFTAGIIFHISALYLITNAHIDLTETRIKILQDTLVCLFVFFFTVIKLFTDEYTNIITVCCAADYHHSPSVSLDPLVHQLVLPKAPVHHGSLALFWNLPPGDSKGKGEVWKQT